MPKLLYAAPFALASLALAACGGPGDEPVPEDPVIQTDSADATQPETVSAPESTEQAAAGTDMADAELDDACGASKVEPYIGQEATVPVRIEVAKAAGAASDRWIYPDSIVTMDRRADRLNVMMEKGTDRIVSAHCG